MTKTKTKMNDLEKQIKVHEQERGDLTFPPPLGKRPKSSDFASPEELATATAEWLKAREQREILKRSVEAKQEEIDARLADLRAELQQEQAQNALAPLLKERDERLRAIAQIGRQFKADLGRVEELDAEILRWTKTQDRTWSYYKTLKMRDLKHGFAVEIWAQDWRFLKSHELDSMQRGRYRPRGEVL